MTLEDTFGDNIIATHKVWHRFYNWLVKYLGSDLHGDWVIWKIKGEDGKTRKIKFRSFNELELSRRMVGYKVIKRIISYTKQYCPEIKVINCDDSAYAGSIILLIPHPKHGITIMFVPQCDQRQNQFFLYENHFKNLTKALSEMSSVYHETEI